MYPVVEKWQAVRENDDLEDSWGGHILKRRHVHSAIWLRDELKKATAIHQFYNNYAAAKQKSYQLPYRTFFRVVGASRHSQTRHLTHLLCAECAKDGIIGAKKSRTTVDCLRLDAVYRITATSSFASSFRDSRIYQRSSSTLCRQKSVLGTLCFQRCWKERWRRRGWSHPDTAR